MRALTVRQPWAGAIFTFSNPGGVPAKDVENRTGRMWSYRGPLAIHAGTAPAPEWAFGKVEELTGRPVVLGAPREGPRWTLGAVIGVVDLTDAHTEDACRLSCSPWALPAAGPDGMCPACRVGTCRVDHAPAIHYTLARPRALRLAAHASGRLGLWNLDARTAERVRFALHHETPEETP